MIRSAGIRGWVAFFVRVVRIVFLEKMTFEQRLEGEGIRHVALRGKSVNRQRE